MKLVVSSLPQRIRNQTKIFCLLFQLTAAATANVKENCRVCGKGISFCADSLYCEIDLKYLSHLFKYVSVGWSVVVAVIAIHFYSRVEIAQKNTLGVVGFQSAVTQSSVTWMFSFVCWFDFLRQQKWKINYVNIVL